MHKTSGEATGWAGGKSPWGLCIETNLFKHTLTLMHGPFENLKKWMYRIRLAIQTRVQKYPVGVLNFMLN